MPHLRPHLPPLSHPFQVLKKFDGRAYFSPRPAPSHTPFTPLPGAEEVRRARLDGPRQRGLTRPQGGLSSPYLGP